MSYLPELHQLKISWTCFIPHTYPDWENMEVNESNFSLNKEI